MKNLVINLRTAKAQAEGCAKVTKSSRMAKVLTTLTLLLTLCVGQMWGDTNRVVYCAISDATKGSYTLKVNANIGDNNTWRQYTMSLVSGKTFNGKKVYTATVSEKYGGVDALQFQLYDGSTWKAQKQPISSWSTSGNWAGKICDYENGDNGTIDTYTTDKYYLEGNTSWISSGWNANATSLMTDNGDYTWSKTVTSVGSNSTWHVMKVYGAYGASGTIWRGVSDYSEATHPNITATQGSDNFEFKPALSTSSVTVTYDALAGTFSVTCAAPTITFDREGGSGGPASQNTYYNEATSSITAPTKSYHDFGGYWTGDDGTGTQVIGTNGAWIKNVSNFTDNSSTAKWIVTANYTLHAKWTPKTYTITYKDQGGGSYTGSNGASLPTSYTYGTGIATLTDGVKSGYRFDGWFTTSACTGDPVTTISTSATGNKIFYAKWTENPGGTVSLTAGTGGEVSTDNSSWGTSKSHTGIKSTTPLNIYARANSGYTFNTWTKTSGSGTITTNAASGVFTPVANADAALTASFTEIKYTVNVALADASQSDGTTDPNGDVQVGAITPVTITAPMPKTGYRSTGRWTTTGGVNVANETANPTTITATSAGTVRWTFDEDLTCSWYVNSDANPPFTGWGTSGNRMQKKSGHSTEEIYYKTLTITTPGDYSIKMYNDAGTGNKYYQDKNNSGTSKSVDVATCNGVAFALDNASDKPNMTFKAYLAGDYEFKLDNTGSSPTLTITWPEINQVRISAASPADAGNVGNFDLSAPVSNVRSKTLSLNANTTYTFKIVSKSDWYGYNSGTFTRSTSTSSNSRTLSTSGGDMTLTTDYAGYYTFKFNESTKELSIDFPEAYKITWGVGTVPGNKYAITCKKYSTETAVVSNSTWIKSGDKVTFYAGNNDADKVVKDGYTWRGYYSEAAGTTQLSNQTGYSPVINAANMSFYACFYENDYTVTVNAGTGGKVNSLSSTTITGHKDTKANLPIATADPGYYFVNWTTTAGTLTNSTYATTGKINGLTSTATVTANFAPIWTIAGLGGDWNVNKLPLTNTYVDATVNYAYLDIDTLRPNTTYYFKAIQRSQGDPVWWRAESASNKEIKYTNSNTRLNMVSTTGDNFTLKTAGAGRYTFDVNLDGAKHPIKVHFPTSYTVTFGYGTGGSTVTATVEDATTITTGQYAAEGKDITFTQTPATGYTFKGWYNAESGGTAISRMASDNVYDDIAANITVYAQYDPKTYTVTLTNSGTGYGSGGQANLTATYDAAFPSITLPTAAQGYGFMGYWSAANGEGTQFTDAEGHLLANIEDYSDADGNWKYDGTKTLYAYYKKAEITDITFSTGYVIAPSTSTTVTATLSPEPVGPTTVCWTVLHNNDNPLDPPTTFSPTSGKSVSFTTPATSASYKIVATLRKGSTCGSGDIIDQDTVNFQVAGDHIVTVQYKCGDATIKESTTITGRPLDWSDEITAPEIFGYTFWKWVAEDGVSITTNDGATTVTETTTATIKIKAIYDGRLVAKYQEKSVIYFKNTLGWSDVYVHFLDGSYWNATNGSGNKSKSNCNKHMTRIGETDIWYFDYGAVSITPSLYIAFTSASQNNVERFAAGVSVVYTANYWQDVIGTDKSAENGFKAATPMYVPLAGQTKTKMGSYADYYNRGYWTKYTPGTGYSLKIYNSAGNTLLKHIAFTSEDELMPMTAVVDLEANTTYKYELLREGDVYYGNDGTMNYSNHGQSTAWDMTWKDGGHKAGLTTTASGDYTFNLSFSENDNNQYRMRIAVDYPIKNGDYRLVYTDDTRSGRLKPSAIVPMVNNGKDTVSFFVRKDKHPQVRIQKATVASGGAITWAEYPTPGTQTNQITGVIATAIRTDSVYNFNLSMNESGALSVTSAERYLGDFYIRTDAETGSKWDNYKTPSHTMTYSQYSEENSDYTHYWMAHVWGDNNTNIKFVIANDYSPCISDTMIRSNYRGSDAAFVDGSGVISAEANIRFMWNKNNNSINRAYLSPAKSNGSKFLVLRGTDADNLLSESGAALTGDSKAIPGNNHGGGAHCMQFSDDENWIYEATVKVKPESYVKLYARFAITVDGDGMPATYTDLYYKGNNNNTFDGSNAIKLITGNGDHLLVRVIYDFKTDRLLAAYLPSGNINSEMDINADVMFIREHQGDIAQVTFSGGGKITDIKTAYAVMRFNKWTLNNKSKTGSHEPLASPLSRYERDLFYISFPFDVNLNEVFGFGTYGTHWIIEEYDGASRAAKGFWKDSPTFWKFITNRNGVVLHKNVGYLLALDLDELGVDAPVWGVAENETAELFFPSSGTMPDITSGNVTATLPEHTCTIVRDGADRRIADSHWNIMGVPTYVNTTNISFANTTWTTGTKDPENGKLGPQFLYTWNASDNTLTPTTARGFTYHAMHAYTVQYYGNVTWTTSVSPSSVVARQQTAPTEYEWCLELQQNEKMIDRTYVRMSDEEEVTTGFEFGYDMSKDLNRNKANIYSYIGSEMVAGNSMPLDAEQTTIVPLGVVIATSGDYTFAIPDGTNGIGITLIDEETGIRTSLSALDYTVELAAGDYTERFWLEISPVKGTETGTDPGVDARENGVRKVMIDGLLYIVRDGKMYDATGKRVE